MDTGGEIRLGSMLFTLVEPHRGHEIAYNRWYERDHFYAGCMVGPWLFSGSRWVATRPLKDMRFGAQPDLFGGSPLGSYLAIYFVIAGKHDDHFDWGLKQVQWLHTNGRMFEHRDHIHTLLYKLRSWSGPDDGVPPELALDHRFGGLGVTVLERADGASADEFDAEVRALAGEDLAMAFDPVPLAADAPVSQRGLDRLDRRLMALRFVESPPGDWWTVHREVCGAIDGRGHARVLWSAPFIPTVPGTDTYTDELW